MVGFVAGLLDATVRASTVLIFASLGEIISERGGVLNLGVEGMMLFGLLEALKLRSQAISVQVGPETPLAGTINPILEFLMYPTITATYPYLATILVLFVTVVRFDNDQLGVPSALLEAYSRETD
jgi:ABC-type uncharacterized transport system permease subunit